FNTERAALPDDFGSKIDFVVRWPNAGAELNNYVGGIGAEAFNHLPDRVRDDPKLGSFASGMHKANSRCFWIQGVNCAAVRDVNAERDAALIRDNSVATVEFPAINPAGDSGRYSAFDNGDLVSVDLLRGEQRPIEKPGCVANFAMRGIEPLQHFGFIMRNVDAGNSVREDVMTDSDRAERRKLFEGQMHHLKIGSQDANTN